MTKTKLDKAYQRGVKSGQDAGFIDAVFHDMGGIVANTVIGASGLSVTKEAEAEEKGYQYGLSHRASQNLKQEDSCVSSSSSPSSYSDSGSSGGGSVGGGGGVLFVLGFIALGIYTLIDQTINDRTTGYAAPSALIPIEERVKNKEKPVQRPTAYSPPLLTVSPVGVPIAVVSSAYQSNDAEKIVYGGWWHSEESKKAIHSERGAEKLMRITSSARKESDAQEKRIFTQYKTSPQKREMHGAQKLMELSKKKNIKRPPQRL